MERERTSLIPESPSARRELSIGQISIRRLKDAGPPSIYGAPGLRVTVSTDLLDQNMHPKDILHRLRCANPMTKWIYEQLHSAHHARHR